MISIEKLIAVRIIVTHENCADGTASAIILHDALPKAEIRFIQYGSEEYKNLPVEPGMLFCDFSPPPERAQEFVDAGAIVLDHHKYAKPVVEMFGDNGVFADETAEPGICGAMLAYQHVWLPLAALPLAFSGPFLEHFATIAGVRDTWQRQDPRWEEACAQAAVLRLIPNATWLSLKMVNLRKDWKNIYVPLGRLLVEKQNEDVARAGEKGWRFTTDKGLRVIVIGSVTLTSDVADREKDVDLVVGFFYTHDQGAERPTLVLSLRSRTTFDCGAFCKAHGGGGHTKAAGCSFSLGVSDPNPYTFVEELLRRHEAQLSG